MIEKFNFALLFVQTVIIGGTLYWAARQSQLLRRSIESSVYMGIVERGNLLFERILDYPRTLGPLFFEPNQQFETPQEEAQLYMRRGYLLGFFNLFHVVFLSHSHGVVDDQSWSRWKALITYFLGSHQEFTTFWTSLPIKTERYHPDFVRLIDALSPKDATTEDDCAKRS